MYDCLLTRLAMVRDGPCVAPDCTDPEESAGQWQYVPNAFCVERGLCFRTDCVCKRPDCLRWCGIMPPKQSPGRPRKTARTSADDGALEPGYALKPERAGCPPFIEDILEIWGVRCAGLFCSPCTPAPLAEPAARAHRYVNPDAMDDVARSNKLQHAAHQRLEYLVLGKWRRRDGDELGVHGAWWVPYTKLLDTFDETQLDKMVAAFEKQQTKARKDVRKARDNEVRES